MTDCGHPRGVPLFFLLSKTLGIMLLPTNFLIGLGLVGAVLLATRFASLGRKLLVAVVAACWRSAPCRRSESSLLYPLERAFRHGMPRKGAPDGIIVLGGPIDADLSAAHGVAVVSGAADRIIAAAALAHRYPERAPALYRRQREPGVERCQGSRLRGRTVRKPRHRQIASADGTALAQHPGKRRILQGAGRAESRRAMAAGDIRLSTCRARSACFARPDLRWRPIRSTGGSGGRKSDLLRILERCRSTGWHATDPAVREWMGLIAYGPPARSMSCCRGPVRQETAVATRTIGLELCATGARFRPADLGVYAMQQQSPPEQFDLAGMVADLNSLFG